MAGSSDPGPRVALVRLGCRVNQADAEAALRACGARPPGARAVDAVLVSTCIVTADAESTALQAVRRAVRDHPGAPVVVCGCAATLRRAALEELGAAAVVAPGDVEATALAIRAAAARRAGVEPPALRRRGGAAPHRARPVVKIQDGCDRRCAYCVVPRARGRPRSLAPDAALEQVRALGRESDEVVLAGIHLGAYGADLGSEIRLDALIRAIADGGLVHRVRLSSIDPLEVPFAAMAGSARELLCGHFHLPIQSGSDRVLARMRRPYAASAAAAVVERIARAMPGAHLAMDVMAGFPGETEADHRATVDLVSALPVASLHVFTFSPRPGTAAASMTGAVPAEVARDRAAELRAVSERAWRAYVDRLVGREVEAVVERVAGGEARGTLREGVLARWILGAEAPRRGRAVRLRAIAREREALRCVRA